MRYIIKLAVAAIIFSGCVKDKPYEANLPDSPTKLNDFKLDANKVFKHPGCVVAQSDIDRAKRNLTVEPWKTGYRYLTTNSSFTNQTQLSVNEYIFRNGPNSYWESRIGQYVPAGGNFDRPRSEAAKAYAKAIHWKITGNTASADFAIKLLNAWAKGCKGIYGDQNRALAFGEFGYSFANTAEIMRDYPGWKKEDFDAFKQWMLTIFVPGNMQFMERKDDYDMEGIAHYWSNWDLFNLSSLISIGVLCDRTDLYNYVIDYVQNGDGNGSWKNLIRFIHPPTPGQDDIELGQTQESGRDQGHNQLCLDLASIICRTAWNQGDDIFGYRNNGLLKAAEYVAKYNYTTGLTYPFQPLYPNAEEFHSVISSVSRGTKHSAIWTLIGQHYKKYKGLEPRYVKMGAAIDSDSTIGLDAETSHAGLSFGTLLYSEEN